MKLPPAEREALEELVKAGEDYFVALMRRALATGNGTDPAMDAYLALAVDNARTRLFDLMDEIRING